MASSSTAGQIRSQPENAFDGLGPYSAPKSTEPRHIFINHRGCDVKYTLATDIYNKLHSLGFSVFLDVEALQAGDSFPAEVQHAMATATLHIAIFSPNYAQSPWCLAELTFMLKTGAQIIPIFYHVDPSDLRYIEQGKGIYADAFSKHDKDGRYPIEKLLEWKRALNVCSYRHGYAVKDSRDEATVLKNIVNDALIITKRKGPLSVAKHPVGMDELVQEFESRAREETVKIRGIVGMGGSGKTTLAKEIFNRKFSSFERCSFVSDVRDAASRSALPDKQKKLLRDLGVDDLLLQFHDVDEGKVLLANRFTSSVRALIVLDDVDHIDQLDALFPNKDDLGSLSSMIIVTTRDLGVLVSWRLTDSCIYRMPGLDKSHAEQLFCWHAFFQPSPPAEFQTLVEEFLKACNGLPLSLKVLGAQLCGNDTKAYWKLQLNKISRMLPVDIKQRLQVSYDALDEEDKEMFLDVACFLIGEEKNMAIAVWDGSGWSGLLGLKTLENKCLVELVKEKVVFGFKEKWKESRRIRMHDQLRDMGREIASRQSPYRLWCPHHVHDKMKPFAKRNPIRGILPGDSFVAFKEYTHQLKGKAIRRSKRLRFTYGLQILSVKGNQFTEEFASLSQDLVWLRWEDFPLINVPSWLTLKNLKVLELHSAYELEQLWQDDAEPPLKLSELILTGCQKLQRFPSSFKNPQDLKSLAVEFVGSSLSEDQFCVLPSLENLHLSSLMLSSLPDDFGNLRSLGNLSLQSCEQLSMLPDSFSQLIHLTDLNLSSCKILSSLPDGFGNLTSLKNLSLKSCVQLSMLPDSFSQLIHLTDLNLSHCEILSSLPDAFGNLTSLRNLSLEGCVQLSMLPDSFSQLIHLTDLNLSSCEILSSLPDGFGNLTSLKNLSLESCVQLSMLPDFSQPIHLTDLNFKNCEIPSSLPDGFGNLTCLKNLSLKRWWNLEMLPDSFSQLIHLTNLDLSYCKELFSLPDDFGYLTSLTNLKMCGCSKLTMLPDSFSQLIHLTHLDLSLCTELSSLPDDFCYLTSLTNLIMYRCSKLTMLPDSFSQLIHLTNLNLSYWTELSSLPDDFGYLTSLTNLEIYNCSKLTMLPDSFSQLIHLTNLNLSFCTELSSLPDDFGYLTSLTNLEIFYCSKLTMLPDSFSQLIHLTNLDLSYCRELSSLPDDFGYLTSLTNLKMCGGSKLTMLPDSFSQLIHLTHLDLSFCEMLFSLPDGFGNLTSLRNLKMDSCKQLSTLPDSFTQLLHLEILHIPDCEKLYLVLDNSDKLRSLKNLCLSKCNQLSVLPDSFSQLIQLEILSISGCEMLFSLPDNFGNLSGLRSISLINCKRLYRWPASFSQLHLTDLHLEGCEMISSLPEMLPVSLNKLKIFSCNSLKSVRCISHGLTNLETLEICDCLQIEELPSFTGLASLKKIEISECPEIEKMEGLVHVKEFDVLDCPKVEKIEGLEHVRQFKMSKCPKVVKVQGLEHAKSLNALTLKTSWKEAGIQSLGNVERLEVLILECETISALKPCIQSTKGKECAREVWIKGSAIRLEEPIVNHLEAISNLKVFKPPVVDGDSDAWHVPEIPDSSFFLISLAKVPHGVSYLYYVEQEEGNGGERKVVCICYTENTEYAPDIYFPPNRAIKVSGKRDAVLEAFYQILELLE